MKYLYLVILFLFLLQIHLVTKRSPIFPDILTLKKVDTKKQLERTSSISQREKIDLFKKIVKAEIDNSLCDSLTLKNKEQFEQIRYLKNIFNVNKIDSVEFYGRDILGRRKERMIPMKSSMIIYSREQEFYSQAFDSLLQPRLYASSTKVFDSFEDMFKPGGIIFRIDNTLIIYSVNGCRTGYKNVLRIDSLIHKIVFSNREFYRLHSGCGVGRLKEVNE